jgi:flagellar motor switch protein FliM
VRRITDRALQSLTEIWANLVDVKFTVAEVESNPQLVQIVAPNEVVVVIGFEIKMSARTGTMSLCIPFNVIEPVMHKLAAQGWVAYQRPATDEGCAEQIAGKLEAAELELQAYLAETTITVGELLNLQPGDIIQTAKPASAPVTLQIEEQNKFRARLGRHKDNRAVRIIGTAGDEKL